MLPRYALQMRIQVERACLDFVECLDVSRAQIDAVHRADHCARHRAGVTGDDERRRRREEIDAETNGVAKIRRSEKQQHNIGTIAYAPCIERLAEIARLPR